MVTTMVERFRTRRLLLDGGVNLGHVDHEVLDTGGVSPLVIVPGDELDEVGVKHDACASIEGGGHGPALQEYK